jgi:hypothetical protein
VGFSRNDPPFRNHWGFIVAPSHVKAPEFSPERERALASLIFLQKTDLLTNYQIVSKPVSPLEMSSIFDILGVLSEQTHFSITVHRFRDSLDSLEYRSGILKPQDLDKVFYLSHENQGDVRITPGMARSKAVWEKGSRTDGASAHVRP